MFTQEQLTEKTGPELVAIFNGIPGVSQIKRFTNRDTGVKRILTAQTATILVTDQFGTEAEVTLGDPVVEPKSKRGRKKEDRGTYNLTGGENKRPFRENSFRGRLLAILTVDGATFKRLLVLFPERTEDQIHGTIKMASRWLGFNVTTDDNGIIRASR